MTLDDRAITFRGVWPEVDDLRRFQPWTKGHSDLDAERRARLADILETVARDGLPGLRATSTSLSTPYSRLTRFEPATGPRVRDRRGRAPVRRPAPARARVRRFPLS